MESISIKGKRGRPRILYADTKYNMPLNKFYPDGKHVRSKMPDLLRKSIRRKDGSGNGSLLSLRIIILFHND